MKRTQDAVLAVMDKAKLDGDTRLVLECARESRANVDVMRKLPTRIFGAVAH